MFDSSQILELLSGLDVEQNKALAPYTTFKVGGPAKFFVDAQNEAEIIQVLDAVKKTRVPFFILGGGSNLLISDKGFDGLILYLGKNFSHIEATAKGTQITVGTGASFPKLTRQALMLGWKPALGFLGTPGQVGGALKMNAGTRLGEIGDVVLEVHAITPEGKKVFSKQEAGFKYRSSDFPKKAILTKAILKYDNPSPQIKDELLEKAKALALKRKQTQPKHRSAGSMFKNPKDGFAGKLIEECGLKGFRINDAQVSTTHANFIVNLKKASASDLHKVANHVQQEVLNKFNIQLEYEVKLVGDFS